MNQKSLKSSITVDSQEQVRSSMSVVDGNIALRSRKIWWVFHETCRRHQMEPFSALPGLYEGNSSVTSQRPVTRGFHVFCDRRLNKLLSKQSRCWWFETLKRSLWHHCNKKTPKATNLHCARRGFVLLNRCYTLHWRHNGYDSVSNHQPHDCLLNGLFRRRSKEISNLRVTGLCAGNSPEAGEFPAQMSSDAENVSIWWRHHEIAKHRIIIRHV